MSVYYNYHNGKEFEIRCVQSNIGPGLNSVDGRVFPCLKAKPIGEIVYGFPVVEN